MKTNWHWKATAYDIKVKARETDLRPGRVITHDATLDAAIPCEVKVTSDRVARLVGFEWRGTGRVAKYQVRAT